MLENTLENKSRFMANYWMQRVLCFNDENQYVMGECYYVDGSVDDYIFLELTPLSAITDEDAIEVAKILNETVRNDRYKEVIIDYFDGHFETTNSNRKWQIMHVTDYLRSKSYALPWMGLSVEDLVNYGWVKLK